MSRVVCRLSSWLPDSTPFVSGMFDRHREVCLRCQAEAAQLRSVSRDIGGLDDEVVRAPGGFHTQVMATLPQQDASDPRRPLVMRLVVRRAVVAVVVAVAMLAAILGRRVRRKE